MLKKTNIRSTLFLLLLLISSVAMAQIESRRILSQNTYQINQEATLSINHKFGTITIKNHESNTISAEVAAKINAVSEAEIEKILGNITLLMSGDEEGLRVETIFDDDLAGNRKNRATIEMIFYLPEYVAVSVTHKFGLTKIETLTGTSNLNCDYGTLEIKSLKSHDNKIKALHSKVNIGFAATLNLKSEHSTLKIGRIGDGKIESVFSTIKCENAEFLRLTAEGGKIEIGSTDHLRLNTTFTTLDITEINLVLIAKSEYTTMSVAKIGKTFRSIDIDATYSTFRLNFGDDPDFQLSGFLQASKFDFPQNEWGAIVTNKDAQAIKLSGNTPTNQSSATVKINGAFNNFQLR